MTHVPKNLQERVPGDPRVFKVLRGRMRGRILGQPRDSHSPDGIWGSGYLPGNVGHRSHPLSVMPPRRRPRPDNGGFRNSDGSGGDGNC